MKTVWRNVLGVILVAAISSGVTIGTNVYLLNNRTAEVKSDTASGNLFDQSSFRLAALSGVAAENTDFTAAAENSVHGVVHIKSITEYDENDYDGQQYYVDPFEYFFGFGGRGFQRPTPQPKVGMGSGVIISTDGYIITNNHVIEGATKLEVTLNDNRKFTAKLVGTDPATDIALLKIDAKGLTVIPFGDSDKLKVGEWVLAIGNPFNLTSTVTAGIVSAKSRGNIGMTGDVSKIESFIQTDAAVNPGNSGGALVNTKGELVGINTAIYSRTGDFSGYSFAVPISIAKKVAADLKEFGVVQRAMLGVSIKSVQGIDEVLNYPNLSASEKAEFEEAKKNVKVTEGVCVMGYATRSGAKEAGIEKYDVITKVNGTTVKTESALQEQISKFRPGDEVEITVDRKGTKKTFKVKLYNTQGNTEVVKSKGDVADVLGAAFEALSDKQKREYDVSCGIEVTGVLNGELKNAGIKKGFIITVVNDQKIYSPEQLEKLVEKVLRGSVDEQYLVIKGFYPNGRSRVFAIELND